MAAVVACIMTLCRDFPRGTYKEKKKRMHVDIPTDDLRTVAHIYNCRAVGCGTTHCDKCSDVSEYRVASIVRIDTFWICSAVIH